MSKKNKQSEIEILKMYSADFDINAKSGQAFELTPSGSLGLLALGYKGLIAWRKKRNPIKIEKILEAESYKTEDSTKK